MGVQESKPTLQRKPTKTKSNLTEKSISLEDIASFSSELSTLACIQSTSETSYEYVAFQKLPFSGHFSQLPLCSKISVNYDSVFICYDCCIDDHAYLCQPCFEKGKHENHRFSVFPNNDGWRQLFCRCGDGQFMKKKTICQKHAKIAQSKDEPIDKKEISKFAAYFNEIFKVLFSSMIKERAQVLLNSIFGYLLKATQTSLYYSKIVCEFFLQKNIIDGESTNLCKFIELGGMRNFRQYNVFRNLNFINEYKIAILREFILGLNKRQEGNDEFFELILNFSGKIDSLNALAKDQNLIVGINLKKYEQNSSFKDFYSKLIKSKVDSTQIWKCLVRNQKLKNFIKHQNILEEIIKSLMKDDQYVSLMLQQFLEEGSYKHVTTCLMILSPQFFINSIAPKKSQKKSKLIEENMERKFIQFYIKMFNEINIHQQHDEISSTLLLILPYFSFGQVMIKKLWEQVEKRVQILSKNKEKRVIKEASMNLFEFISKILNSFMAWDHQILTKAFQSSLIVYTKDAELMEKILTQYFDKFPKIARVNMLNQIDVYTQKQRILAKDFIKKNLRYNAKKGKYYNISKKLPNNPFNFDQINIENPFKFTEWQEFISKKFFTDAYFRAIPKLIKSAQKALQEDIDMVKIVANISTCTILLNPKEKKNLKEITRNFVKEIPDVNQNIYYILAKIRDRLQLDVDDMQEKGQKGSKKPKLDMINEIRDKKFRQIKNKQDKMRQKWLKQAQKQKVGDNEQDYDENICVICKEKETPKRRFVYPCNFTRNNVVSTLLKSFVTDLDINICLHKAHEDCFEQVRNKGQCPICKFQINCYIPQKPLADESYSKNWLRNFENLVTNINMQSGKSFNSDWATIFLAYLVFSRSFKVLLKSSELQQQQRSLTDNLIILHYKNQLDAWPELTKQAIKKAQKTVKGQVRRESNLKKGVKTLVFDLVLQQITGEPFKNVKRVEKKFRELINMIGSDYAEKINQCFPWSRENQGIKQVFSSNQAQAPQQLFKLRQLPQKAEKYLLSTSIKCPMCNRYQPTTWQCLFCSKISCSNCTNPKNHCEFDHKGSGIILYLNDARYQLYHDSRLVESDSLYRNQYSEGWKRNENPEGWQAHTDEIYNFFDTILHSQSPFKRPNTQDPDSDNEIRYPNRGLNNYNIYNNNNYQGGFGFTNTNIFNNSNNLFGNAPIRTIPAQRIESEEDHQDNEEMEEQQQENDD